MRRWIAVGSFWLVLAGSAMAQTFSSPTAAMTYISETLPKATAANPPYVTKATATQSVWLTQSVTFAPGPEGGLIVTMKERFTQTQGGKTAEGRHEASFSLNQVTLAEFSPPGDFTPSGEPAQGLLFTCRAKGCIAATWDESATLADTTDVSLQDPTLRARLLQAFQHLQSPK